MKGKFFSVKNTATNDSSNRIYIIRALNSLLNINGAGDSLGEWLSKIPKQNITKLREKIEDYVLAEISLDSLSPEKINKRATNRRDHIVKLVYKYMNLNLAKKAMPRFTSAESDAKILYLSNEVKTEKEKNKKLEETLEQQKMAKSVLTQSENIPQISTEIVLKNDDDLLSKFRSQQNELSKSLLKLIDYENIILKLENEIKSFNEKISEIKSQNEKLEIEKKDLESRVDQSAVDKNRIDVIVNQLKVNEKRLQSFEAALSEKEAQIKIQQESELNLRGQIAALELKIIKFHEADLFLPLFSFLNEFFILSAGLQYQISKHLVNQLKNKELKNLWQNDLFTLLQSLKQSPNPATTLGDWFRGHAPQTTFLIDRHHHLTHLSLENEKLPKTIADYFNEYSKRTFSLNHLTVHYLLSSYVVFEMEHVGSILFNEVSSHVMDSKAFWNECWQVAYGETDFKMKFEKLNNLWKKYQFQFTHVELLGGDRLVLSYRTTTPEKINVELEAQNQKKYSLGSDSAAMLKYNFETFKKSLLSFPLKYPYWPAYLLTNSLSAVFNFGFLSRFLFNISPLSVDLWMTRLFSTALYLVTVFYTARKMGLWSQTLSQTLKTLMSARHHSKNEKLLGEVLELLNIKSFADFEMKMWKDFLSSYEEGSLLVKKIAYEWLPGSKKKIRLTAKIENNELDYFVKHVVLGKVNQETNDEFSQTDFNQIRKLLVSELIDQYLKKTLEEKTTKLLKVLPQTPAAKKIFNKEYQYLSKKLKQRLKELEKQKKFEQDPSVLGFFFSPVYEKDFTEEDLRWLLIYKQYENI